MTGRIGDATRERIKAAWPRILEGLAAGELVRDVLKGAGISVDMMRAYRAENPAAQAEWDQAREQAADALFDEALATARNPTRLVEKDSQMVIVPIDPAHARTLIDTLKWAARIRNPKLYGDKQTIDMNVKTVDLTQVIADANARLAAARSPALIEREPGLHVAPELLALLGK